MDEASIAKIAMQLDFADGEVTSVTFSPDGQWIAAGGGIQSMESSFGIVKVWNLTNPGPARNVGQHDSAVTAIAYSPDGNLLASGSADRTVKLWDPTTGTLRHTLLHSHQILAVAFSPDGTKLASGGYNFQSNLWNAATWERERVFRARGHTVLALRFSPDSQTLVSAGRDNRLKLWNVNTGESLNDLVGHLADVNAVGFANHGRTVVSGSHDATMKLWPADRYVSDHQIRAQGTSKTEIAFATNGTQIAVTASIWEVPSPGEFHLFHLATRQHDVIDLEQFAPRDVACNGRIVAIAGRDLSANRTLIRLWHIPSSTWLKPLTQQHEIADAIEFSPDGRILAAGDGGDIALWDVDARTKELLPTGTDFVAGLAFSPQGDWLAVGAGQGMQWLVDDRWKNVDIQLWNLQSKTRTRFSGHSDIVITLAFSPDGSILASGSKDKTIKLWKLPPAGRAAQDVINPYFTVSTPHFVFGLAFSHDGKTLASGGADGSIRLWNVETGAELTTIARPCSVTSLAFSSDGTTLAAGHADKSVKFFHASLAKQDWPERFP
jgi:WD40 repeat protein